MAEDSYPKKLIIQNSKNKINTIIEITNEQYEKTNREHVALKQCVEYSNIQDNNIITLQKEITSLQSFNISLIKQDSLSNERLKTQIILLDVKKKEYIELNDKFEKYKHQVKRDKIKAWIYSNLVVTPTVIITTALTVYFTKK